MSAPLIDSRTREDIIDEIKALARERVPEWNFDPENPDAGSMLALIWADMLCGTIERLNRVTENYKISLYNSINPQCRPALPSKGLLCFDVSDEAFIPAGSKAAAGDTVFATAVNLHANTAQITEIYSVSPDTCCRYSDTRDIRLFDCRGDNPVIWSIEHSYALNVSEGGSVGLVLSSGVLSALNDPEQAQWEFSDTELRFNILKKEAFEGAEIKNIGLLPENRNLTADAVYSNDIQLPSEGFLPFGERFSLYDEVYFACDEAFEKKGAVIELKLTVKMEKFPIEGFPVPEPSYKPVMRKRDLNIPETFEIFISGIAWEYFNGTGWAALTTSPHRDIFYSTDTLEHIITFTCPPDFDLITVGAHEKRYIRARVTDIENEYKMYGSYWSPFIEALRFGYCYNAPLPPERISCFQNMEETLAPVSIIDRKFTVPAMYLSIDRCAGQGTVLVELEDCGAPAALKWEYHSENGWSELRVDDGTLGFSQTGMISYIAELPWEQTPVFGKQSYWIRVLHTGGGKIHCPKLKRVWNNSVISVCETGGTDGNVQENTVVKLLSAIPGVDAVTNPLPMEGGSGEEEYEDAVRRYMTERRVTICSSM